MTSRSLGRGAANRWNSGVVSLLDEPHAGMVTGIWDELESKLGLREVKVAPWPHVSYQLGDYDLPLLTPILEEVAAKANPFEIETAGLGIFTGSRPIVYVPVVRTAELSEWHRLLWAAIGTACRNIADHYWLSDWIPHITLAMDDVHPANLGAVVEQLAARNLSWKITIDNLSFIDAGYEGRELTTRLPFGSRA